MLKIIAEKLKFYEELKARLIAKRDFSKEKSDKFYYHGALSSINLIIKDLEEMQRFYEENVQSIEESMRFLRGE